MKRSEAAAHYSSSNHQPPEEAWNLLPSEQKMNSPSIEEVLELELEQVQTSRSLRLTENPGRPSGEKSLIGLAFSGGGIRSATFNLGVLQALAKRKLLRSLDYISTVSGGGYIGGWLMGWMHHQQIGIREIEERLSTPPKMPGEAGDQPEVHFLRDYSNYLTPRKGLLSADFLAFAASYIRNTLLNQIILVLALLSLLLLPRTIVAVLLGIDDLERYFQRMPPFYLQEYLRSQNFALVLFVLLGLLAVIFIGLNLETVDPHEGIRDPWYAKPRAVHIFIIAPLLASSALFTYAWGYFLTDWEICSHFWFRAPLVGVVLYCGMWTGACLVRRLVHFRKNRQAGGSPVSWLVMLTAAGAGILIGYLLVPFGRLLIPPEVSTASNWQNMTFATPVSVLIMLIAGILHIGLMGNGMSDAHREWWGRLGGLLVLYALCWFALFLVAINFPHELKQFWEWESSHPYLYVAVKGVKVHVLSMGSILTWILSTAYGVFFGKSEKTSQWNPDAPPTKKLLAIAAKLTPYIFILGLLLGLSVLASHLANFVRHANASAFEAPKYANLDIRVPVLCLAFLLAALFVSWRVNINEFSIHYLYRNRLVRCYLGASVKKRNAQPFTGFSERDNFPLGHLIIPAGSTDSKDGRPLPILNTSLNVVRGKELALQSRKARSFALTPIYGGFTRTLACERDWQATYAPTKKLACRLPGFKEGVTMGTAVAISGAAASPNMGSYSDPGLGFLMTLFDVRLGWWIGNPSREGLKNDSHRAGFASLLRKLFGSKNDGWKNGSPRVGFLCLLQELLGSTNDDSKYVYLSDGGHFENLAVYELVRRRCKLIIASDASCDPEYTFGDLHNAVEKCRTDFGVEIVLSDLQDIVPKAGSGDPAVRRAEAHFALGKIHYNPDSPEEDGTIIYLKPALLDSDPCDVLAYAQKDKSFPHDSTANQWFDEAHFENYRALGEVSASAARDEIAREIGRILG
jgi:predicted acylesterase/phospholipase RssA